MAEWCLFVFIVFWFWALGSTIGSFLNVVIYRLPLGLNLSHPPSRCPDCETPIAFRDNIPVIGWLKLGGRCRNCRTPISSRYPLVEGTVGLVFVILMLTELHTGGANLPIREIGHTSGLNWMTGRLQPDLFGIYTLHCILMCTLIAATLIVFDGERLPVKLFMPIVLLGLVLPTIWPALHPVPLCSPPPGWLQSVSWNHELSFTSARNQIAIWLGFNLISLAMSLVGYLCGTAFGCLWFLSCRIPNRFVCAGAISLLGVIGLILGWQAVLSVAVIAVLIVVLFAVILGSRLAGLKQIPLAGWITFAVLIQIVFWKPIYQFFPWH